MGISIEWFIYYTAIKGNEKLIHATIWINLKSIMLSERRQTQRVTHGITQFVCSKTGKSIETESIVVFA